MPKSGGSGRLLLIQNSNPVYKRDMKSVKDGFGNHDSETMIRKLRPDGNYSLIRHNGKHTTKTRQIYIQMLVAHASDFQ